LELNRETVWLELKNDQLTRKKKYGLGSATVEKRFKRAKILQSWHAGDVKMFVLEQQLNVQNDIQIDRSTIPKCVRGYGVRRNFQGRASTTTCSLFNRGQ
jgi:hypothetical protein